MAKHRKTGTGPHREMMSSITTKGSKMSPKAVAKLARMKFPSGTASTLEDRRKNAKRRK